MTNPPKFQQTLSFLLAKRSLEQGGFTLDQAVHDVWEWCEEQHYQRPLIADIFDGIAELQQYTPNKKWWTENE